MNRLRYTLLADGTSDRSLLRIIDWALGQIYELRNVQITSQFAEPSRLALSPKDGVAHVREVLRSYPCDILFFHRDAEKEPYEKRREEIQFLTAGLELAKPVPIIPVRMTEAWLLISEPAIRLAADNPNGKVHLSIPAPHTLENLSNPKQILKDLLLEASEKSGRRLKIFQRDINLRLYRVATYIDDFSPLRSLSAFQAFESDTCSVVQTVSGQN